MFRLQHEVIVFVGPQKIDDFFGPSTLAMFDQRLQIGTPPAEIIIHIDDRHAGLLGTLFQAREISRHRGHISHQLFRFWKIEIVDHVNDQQRRRTLIRRTTVKVAITGGHSFRDR